MDQSNNKSFKVGAGVAVILMIAAITWGGWSARINKNLEAERDQEKLRSEQLLSEKLLIERNLATAETHMDELVGKNEGLIRKIEEAKNLSDLKDGHVSQLQKQLAANRKAYNALSMASKEMENKIALLDQQLSQQETERLAANHETESLLSQIENLKRELAATHNAYYDNVLVESSRGNKDKLVVKANRTRKLRATVIIPSSLKEIQFQIFDPSGMKISSSPQSGVLAVSVTENDNAIASSESNGSLQTFKKAEMIFLPKRKLKPGVYRIEVLSENLSVGSLQVRLR
jgi:hypothetical protein